ncbi:PREDICTED: uncharacterized protein LOC107190428 [Dufourea novaeangliae]|uniref:uncharacterized protein LOC107190428 n=1 Tax=Dufourea novaeangliae TaxID=178035 RepID=UPI00076745EA|nr:PREDICTED: uncharacterized protein LOC107190428 [Dufourea novaeangliae]
MSMNFQKLNNLNILGNIVSANMLPMTGEKTKMPTVLKLYVLVVWTFSMIYFITILYGLLKVPKDKVLKGGAINMVVMFENLFLMLHFYNNKKVLRQLIRTLNSVLTIPDEILRTVTTKTVMILQKAMKTYIIFSISALIFWMPIPVMEAFHRNQFYYEDYQLPMAVSKEPFSTQIFVAGSVFQFFGAVYSLIRKLSLDLYSMHIILLMTAQYKYLNKKFTSALASDPVPGNENQFRRELGGLIRHHRIVLRMTALLKQVFSLNVTLLYVTNVFRLCFLSFMIATASEESLVACLVIIYTIGALMQLYMFCFCVQQLVETVEDSPKEKDFQQKVLFEDFEI